MIELKTKPPTGTYSFSFDETGTLGPGESRTITTPRAGPIRMQSSTKDSIPLESWLAPEYKKERWPSLRSFGFLVVFGILAASAIWAILHY